MTINTLTFDDNDILPAAADLLKSRRISANNIFCCSNPVEYTRDRAFTFFLFHFFDAPLLCLYLFLHSDHFWINRKMIIVLSSPYFTTFSLVFTTFFLRFYGCLYSFHIFFIQKTEKLCRFLYIFSWPAERFMMILRGTFLLLIMDFLSKYSRASSPPFRITETFKGYI